MSVFFCLLLFPAAAAAAPASSTVPLDSWVYPAVEKLAGFGLIESDLQAARPWTRLEAARLVTEATARAQSVAMPPVARALLGRLRREFASASAELHGAAVAGYFKPVQELRLDYLYRDGLPATFAGPGVVASQFSLNTNNFGIDYDEGHNAQALLESEARLGRFFLVQVRPLLSAGESATDLALLEGKAALALGPLELSAGRQALWWGQGRHGSLVLTNNAKPLDMLRVTNPTPVLLPWIFAALGPFRFDLFWSRLEDYRADLATGRGDEPYFAGLRFSLKPVPWFELGAARTVMFGGDDIDVDAGDFITILGGKNLSGGQDTSNSLAAVDARLRLPVLWGAEVYGEVGGEDEAGAWIANKSWLAGIFLPRLEPSGRASLRVEYADLSNVDNNSPVWYRHGTYKAGYTYNEKIMGHHAGGAAKDLFGEIRLELPHDVTAAVFLDYEQRGYDQPLREKHLQPGLQVAWPLSEQLRLEAAYAIDRVDNFGFVQDRRETFHFARTGLVLNW